MILPTFRFITQIKNIRTGEIIDSPINPLPIMVKDKYIAHVWIGYNQWNNELQTTNNPDFIGWDLDELVDIYKHETSKSR